MATDAELKPKTENRTGEQMNALTKHAAGALVANLASLKTALSNVQSNIVTTGGDPFMRLGRDGAWVYGPENIEVEAGSLWAVNIFGLEHGWVAWTDYTKEELKVHKTNSIVHERMVSMDQSLPDLDTLPRTNWEYAQQLLVPLVCTTGDDRGIEVRYKTTATGGLNAMRKLIGDIMTQLDRDASNPVPLIRLLNDSYQHKTYGKTFVPVFDIAKWVAPDAMPTEAEAATPAEAAAPTPAEPSTPVRRRQTVEARGAASEPASADPVAERRKALEAELAALNGTGEANAAPAADAPIRRRR